MKEKDYYGAIKGFCMKWNLPEVWNSDRITGANLIYEVIKVINAMILEQKAMKEMIEEFLLMFNEDLSDTVKDQLTVWLNDGTLGDIINETLFNQKADITYVDAELYKKADKEYVSIKEYGAVGDGVVDDTQAIKQALNENRRVFFPTGVYRTTETLRVPQRTTILGPGFEKNDMGVESAVILYDGPNERNSAVLVLGNSVIGGEPSNPTSAITIKNIFLNGNNKADFGIYGTYLTNESTIDSVGITKTKEYGLYVARAWYFEIKNILSRNNENVGVALGMPLTYSDGTKVEWTTNAPLQMNAGFINNIRCHMNGENYIGTHNTEDYTKGYGLGVGSGHNFIVRNVLCEGNGGVGLLVYNDTEVSKKIDGAYLENNMRDSTGDRVSLHVHNVSDYRGAIILDTIYVHPNQSVLFTGKNKPIHIIGLYDPLKLIDETEMGDFKNIHFDISRNLNPFHYRSKVTNLVHIARDVNSRYVNNTDLGYLKNNDPTRYVVKVKAVEGTETDLVLKRNGASDIRIKVKPSDEWQIVSGVVGYGDIIGYSFVGSGVLNKNIDIAIFEVKQFSD